jgi:hypothetical protein
MKRSSNRGPKRYVEWDGSTYAVRSNKIEIPDLKAMPRFAALQWLISHTHPRGYSRPNPLAGFGGAIKVL